MATLRIVGERQVESLIDTDKAVELARATLRDQAKGDSMLSTPSAMTMDTRRFGSGNFKIKGASVGHLGMAGIRLISRMSATDPNAINYCAVYRHGGLALSGLVAELWISRIRTAAFGAATLEALVPPGPLVVGLFGSGKIATQMMPMLARNFSIREMRVNSRRPESTAAFVAHHAPNVPFAMRAEADGRKVTEGADVVLTITEANAPLVNPGVMKPGSVVMSMGGKHEVHYGVLAESQRLIVDDVDFASEVGDGGAWISQGHFTPQTFAARVDALACEAFAGTKPVRLKPDDRVVAIVQGMAVGDVAFAAYAYQEAERRGIGTVVELPE